MQCLAPRIQIDHGFSDHLYGPDERADQWCDLSIKNVLFLCLQCFSHNIFNRIIFIHVTYAIHWKLWFKPRHVSIHVSQKICAEFSQVSSGPTKSSSVGMGTTPGRSSQRQGTVVETCGLLQRLSSWFCTVSILAFLQHLSSCWIWFSELLLQAYFNYKKKAYYGKNYELLERMFWPSVNFNVDELLPVSQLSSIAVKWWNEKTTSCICLWSKAAWWWWGLWRTFLDVWYHKEDPGAGKAFDTCSTSAWEVLTFKSSVTSAVFWSF